MEVVMTKEHCPCPDCGSSDALCYYSDGHSYCFSCQRYHAGDTKVTKMQEPHVTGDKTPAGLTPIIPESEMHFDVLRARGIRKETCAKYGYYKAQEAQVACYYNDDGTLLGQKLRFEGKRFETRGRKFTSRFFGQNLWANGHKRMIIITEGEIDCLTVSQINGNKYPVVSIPAGVQSAKKVFKAQADWLNSFDKVVVFFDMDEAGRKGVKEIEGILKPHKLFIATLPFKDPNEALLAGKPDVVVDAIWNAKEYKPDGIVNGKDLWEAVNAEVDNTGYQLPWDNIPINKKIMGFRKGELVVLTAGTGVGKSTFVRQIAYDFGVKQKLKIGMLMLEENVGRTAKGLMSVHAGARLYIDRHVVSDEEYRKAFDETLGTGRYVLYEHFGSLDGDNLMNKIRYMAVSENCDFIILDHISIAISGLEGDNERKLIDVLMTQLRSLAEETGVGLIIISHLRRATGSEAKPFEEGGTVSLSQLRGSGAIGQLADTVIGLERNQQAEGQLKNIVRLRVLKCRWTGETGIAGHLFYDKQHDRLVGVERVSDFTQEGGDEENGELSF